MLYVCYVNLWLTEEESTNMNFLELASSLKGEDDLEILEEPPGKVVDPMAPPDKGKEVSLVLSKKKAEGGTLRAEKLMPDAGRTRSSKRLARADTTVSNEGLKNRQCG